ncbi:hypothetical protein IFM89_014478 [Coptis chinensis]|uniref:Uncharacterized protein n=1 Tax=Coptis chinensis TaxID=261450 RepID=A0A835HED5_9MAGN|nr:hypothetical protein IFM89_014478 [Coptis chinensis]
MVLRSIQKTVFQLWEVLQGITYPIRVLPAIDYLHFGKLGVKGDELNPGLTQETPNSPYDTSPDGLYAPDTFSGVKGHDTDIEGRRAEVNRVVEDDDGNWGSAFSSSLVLGVSTGCKSAGDLLKAINNRAETELQVLKKNTETLSKAILIIPHLSVYWTGRKVGVIKCVWSVDPADKEQFWNELANVNDLWDRPWCSGGDFNCVRFTEESRKGCRSSNDMRAFNDFIDSFGLVDFNLSGAKYTYSNHHQCPKMSRIDRYLVTSSWMEHFHEQEEQALRYNFSDHRVIFLEKWHAEGGPVPLNLSYCVWKSKKLLG